jgi:hypothetical protein
VLVLRADRSLATLGETGEIAIRCAFPAGGYANDPELTEKRFIVNPFSLDEHDWLYLTGDLGRISEDGTVEIAGRLDQQIKIRGVRVEPQEIAALLATNPSVAWAFVRSARYGADDVALEAFVVGAAGDEVTESQLRRFVSERLPRSCVPRLICVLDEIPLTPSGKVDQNKLQPSSEIPQPTALQVNDAEAGVAAIWAEILDCGDVAPHDDFFACGGHSLLALRMLSRLRQVTGIAMDIRSVFDAPTLREFVVAVEAAKRGGARTIAAPPRFKRDAREY